MEVGQCALFCIDVRLPEPFALWQIRVHHNARLEFRVNGADRRPPPGLTNPYHTMCGIRVGIVPLSVEFSGMTDGKKNGKTAEDINTQLVNSLDRRVTVDPARVTGTCRRTTSPTRACPSPAQATTLNTPPHPPSPPPVVSAQVSEATVRALRCCQGYILRPGN